jgi:hypothetical protein
MTIPSTGQMTVVCADLLIGIAWRATMLDSLLARRAESLTVSQRTPVRAST